MRELVERIDQQNWDIEEEKSNPLSIDEERYDPPANQEQNEKGRGADEGKIENTSEKEEDMEEEKRE